MRITAATPVHVGTINGHAVRFFRGPDDEPDMPWHAHEDLLASFEIQRALRRTLRAHYEGTIRQGTPSARCIVRVFGNIEWRRGGPPHHSPRPSEEVRGRFQIPLALPTLTR